MTPEFMSWIIIIFFCLFLSDADNAFNSINRPAALWNARILWVRCSRFLFNSYRGFSILIIKGTSEILLSKEGVTQGLPSAMKFYAIGLLPLTLKLKDSSEFVQSEWEMASNEFCFEDVSKILIMWGQYACCFILDPAFIQGRTEAWLFSASRQKLFGSCTNIYGTSKTTLLSIRNQYC